MVMRQKILVTGSNGQLGQELQLLSSKFPLFEFIFLTKDELSIYDEAAVRQIFHQRRPAYCINCAAYTAVDKAESERQVAFDVNANGPAMLASVSGEFNSKFIHISTDYVFDGKSKELYTVDSPTAPQTVYGESKLIGEQNALRINGESLIIRTSWVYSVYGKNFVKTMLRLMSEKKEIKVVNDQFGSPTWAADLADAIMKIIADQQWKPGLYHYSNQGVINWYDFAKAIAELTGSSCKIIPIPGSEYPTPAKRPGYSALDTSKIAEDYGVRIYPWRESLEKCLQRMQTERA
jgi:dTDP-4-dehydrorhamnose reductase